MGASEVRALLDYNRATGLLYWRERPESAFTSLHRARIWNARFAGKVALNNLSPRGYKKGLIHSKTYATHRVVWAWVYGVWPPADLEIDHINHIKTDNRIDNLRIATRTDNCRNKPKRAGRVLPKGVAKVESGRFRAVCQDSDGHQRWLGTFETAQEAAGAYDDAARKWHGAFACTNQEAA